MRCRDLVCGFTIAIFTAFPGLSATADGNALGELRHHSQKGLRYFGGDLATSDDTTGTIGVSWTAPGDDDTIGIADYYTIRYSPEPISETTWDSASEVQNPPLPLPAGSHQSFTLTGLDCGGYYYVAIKTSDEAGNMSQLSNVVENYASGIPTPAPVGAAYDSAGNIVTVYASLVSFHLPIYYEFALDTSSLFSNPLIGVDLIVDTLASTSFGGIQENLGYFWRVRAVTSDRSDSSHWSSADSFYVYVVDNIDPVVAVISPNGGEQWHSGSVGDISWSASDNEGIAASRIDYSSDAGASWFVVGDWSNGNPGVYSWSIPDISSDQCLVRVSCADFAGNIGTDQSDGSFSISNDVPISVTVVTPNGRERWDEMSLQTINWADGEGEIASFKLDYSTDGGDNWTPVCDWTGGDPREYEWQLPPTPSRRSRVRISCRDQQGNEATDASDRNFTIRDATRPHVHVLFPDGGDRLEVGFDTLIVWEAGDNVGVDSSMIEYTTDGGATWDTISNWMAGNPGSFRWHVPNTITGQCLLRTSCLDADGNAASDTSDGPFLIEDTFSPLVTITWPAPNDSLESDSLTILWLAHDNGAIIGFAVGYSSDEGASWIEIAHGNGGDSGHVDWVMPPGIDQFGLRVACIDEALNIGEDTVYFYPTAVNEELKTPSRFSLSQAYPNPFNPSTTIAYALAEPAFVLLEVYDMLGSRVTILVNRVQPAGNYQPTWNARELSSGTYLYKLEAGGFTEVKKMTVLK